MNMYGKVLAVLGEFWALPIRACGLTMRQPRLAFYACSSSRGRIGGEVSVEKQQGRAKNGNAPSEFIARRWYFFHTPFPSFTSLSSRSHKQKSPPHGERQLADGGDFFETTDGVRYPIGSLRDPFNPAGRTASAGRGDPAAFPGLNPARALDVSGKAAVSSPTRGANLYAHQN